MIRAIRVLIWWPFHFLGHSATLWAMIAIGIVIANAGGGPELAFIWCLNGFIISRIARQIGYGLEPAPARPRQARRKRALPSLPVRVLGRKRRSRSERQIRRRLPPALRKLLNERSQQPSP